MAVVSAIVSAVSATVASISAGVAAAGTMIAAGTATAAGMAAVGSALVSVSAVIGVAGLATSVVGLATGNKDLLKAGKVMGYIGLGSAVLGGVTGGIGGLMEGGAGFFEGVKGAFTGASAGTEATPTPADVNSTGGTMFSSETGTSVTAPISQGATPVAPGDPASALIPEASKGMTSIPGVSQSSQIYTANPAGMQLGAGQALSSPVDASTLASSAMANPSVAGSAPLPPPVSSPVSAPDVASAVAPPAVQDAGASYQSLVDSAINPPANYVIAPPAAPSVPNYVAAAPAPAGGGGAGFALDTSVNPLPGYTPQPATASAGQNYTMEGLKQMADPFKAASTAAAPAPSMWASMPEWAKYAAMTTGAQGLTGLASGYYQGLSAEEKLKFEKLVNDQRQQQVNLINTRSAYAPRVTFNRAPGGLVNA